MNDVELKDPGRVRSIAGACVLAGMLASGAVLWAREGSQARFDALDKPPPFPEPSATCAEDRPHALHAARIALETARARMQRYAFAPRDGRDALSRLAEAVDCARLSGDAAAQREAEGELARVHGWIERDAREHAQRYALLRQRDRLGDAAEDVAFLTELGWPEHGAFADQLRRDRIQLEDEAKETTR